jgi:hypothetical protein
MEKWKNGKMEKLKGKNDIRFYFWAWIALSKPGVFEPPLYGSR